MLPGIDIPFLWLSKAIGASVDELKLLAIFLLSYPLAAVLKRLPDDKPQWKNIFSVSITLFYLLGVYDLWRIADPSLIDITGGQMVLIMKLHGFSWNVHDGRLKGELLTDLQKDRAVYKMPDLLDFAGYVFFFPSIFTGPSFEYADYKRWLDGSIYDAQPPGSKAASSKKGKRRIPHSTVPAVRKAIGGLIWIGAFLQFSQWYYVPFFLSDEYMKYSFPYRVWLLQMLGFATRTKYYGVWSLTEGACIMAGISYNGIDEKTGQAKWDHLENVNPWGIETAQNSRAYLDNWNKNTNKWLRNYIYLRVTPKGRKPGFRATLATFLTSALWHGFYPGYYLTFVLAAFIQTVAKNFRRYVRPFFLTPDGTKPTQYKIYYDVLGYVATQLAFCFTTAPFVILGFNDSLKVWARVYFYTVIGVAASLGFFASPAKRFLTKRLDKRNHPHLRKTIAEETQHPPSLGLPNDPAREIDEAIDEIRNDIETRRRRGSTGATMPSGEGLKQAIEQKLGRKLEMPEWKLPQVFGGDSQQQQNLVADKAKGAEIARKAAAATTNTKEEGKKVR
ncbi:hypothetical protein AYO22_02940 [Fonsecaea multimorphosa]|nr:hypothetical protein AYO22_02940 [Fonsecaea multimorphosa]